MIPWDDVPIELVSEIGASRPDGEEKSWEDDPTVQGPIGTVSVQPLAPDEMLFLTDPYIFHPERYECLNGPYYSWSQPPPLDENQAPVNEYRMGIFAGPNIKREDDYHE